MLLDGKRAGVIQTYLAVVLEDGRAGRSSLGTLRGYLRQPLALVFLVEVLDVDVVVAIAEPFNDHLALHLKMTSIHELSVELY